MIGIFLIVGVAIACGCCCFFYWFFKKNGLCTSTETPVHVVRHIPLQHTPARCMPVQHAAYNRDGSDEVQPSYCSGEIKLMKINQSSSNKDGDTNYIDPPPPYYRHETEV